LDRNWLDDCWCGMGNYSGIPPSQVERATRKLTLDKMSPLGSTAEQLFEYNKMITTLRVIPKMSDPCDRLKP